MTTNLAFAHGQNSTTLTNITSLENQALKDNLNYKVESNKILKLNAETAQHIYAKLNGKIGPTLVLKDLHSNINFKESSTKNQTQNYSSQVVYNISGTYDIVFEFEHDENTYVFVLTYKNLTKSV